MLLMDVREWHTGVMRNPLPRQLPGKKALGWSIFRALTDGTWGFSYGAGVRW